MIIDKGIKSICAFLPFSETFERILPAGTKVIIEHRGYICDEPTTVDAVDGLYRMVRPRNRELSDLMIANASCGGIRA